MKPLRSIVADPLAHRPTLVPPSRPRPRPLVQICALLTALPLLAQGPQAVPSASPQAIAIQRNTGLQSDGADGLRGGGPDYDVRFDRGGMYYEAALGTAVATTQHLRLTPLSVGRGAVAATELPSFVLPEQDDRTAVFAHGLGVRERLTCGLDGVEVSWVFDRRPEGSGDLVVHYAVETNLPAPRALAEGGLEFGHARTGGVTIGSVTGIDAVGLSVAGQLRWHAGALEMSLPADFVDEATYPLVLDPLVGTKFGIWAGASYSDAQPDCSYEKTEALYLVCFLRTFSASDVRVRAQRVSKTTGLVGGVSWLSSGTVAYRPRVASFSRLSRCGVVWTEDFSVSTIALFSSVSTVDGSVSRSVSLGLTSQGDLRDLDIGSESGTHAQPQAYVAVWHDANSRRIMARRIGYDPSGAVVTSPGYTVFSDTTFNAYSQPAIARAADVDGKLMVVVRKYAGRGPSRGISSALLSASDNSVTSLATIFSSISDDAQSPDVDGYGSEWVVTWRQNPLSSGYQRVVARAAHLVGTGIQLDGTISLGGGATGQASFPTVGYSRGKTWLGYRYSGVGQISLRAIGIDNPTCLSCADTFSEPIQSADTRIVVATTMSGNELALSEGLIVWGESADIWAQHISNHSGGGTTVNQGGGCGTGGNQLANPPALGMNQVYNSVVSLSPSALLTVFNLSVVTPPLVCGSCSWVPFMHALPTPVTAFRNATIEYSIPCRPELVGAQFETQWTTIDPGATPCGLAPDFVMSDRILHTIGQ